MSQGLTIPPELEAEMTPGVRAFVEMLLGRITQLEQEVADLRQELKKYSRFERQPPQPPAGVKPGDAAEAKKESPKTKRKRGGQPGHRKYERPLIPTDECDDVQTLRPESCRRCGTTLEGDDPSPLRHQVFELPEIKLHVTEYQLHRLTCACCGKQTCAELPEGVTSSQSGPRLVAFWRHQWCWAHLRRDFEKISLREGVAGLIGQRLLNCTYQLFHHWHRVRDGCITRRGFECLMTRLKSEVSQILTEGSCCADSATAATCSELLNHFGNLWLFVYCPGVEPTNNAAERSLRHAVIWKHLSFGTQSDHGSRFVERLLTVIETCRQQKRNPFNFLIDSINADRLNQKAPSLLSGV